MNYFATVTHFRVVIMDFRDPNFFFLYLVNYEWNPVQIKVLDCTNLKQIQEEKKPKISLLHLS